MWLDSEYSGSASDVTPGEHEDDELDERGTHGRSTIRHTAIRGARRYVLGFVYVLINLDYVVAETLQLLLNTFRCVE